MNVLHWPQLTAKIYSTCHIKQDGNKPRILVLLSSQSTQGKKELLNLMQKNWSWHHALWTIHEQPVTMTSPVANDHALPYATMATACAIPVLATRHSSASQIVGFAGVEFGQLQQIPDLLQHLWQYRDFYGRLSLPVDPRKHLDDAVRIIAINLLE